MIGQFFVQRPFEEPFREFGYQPTLTQQLDPVSPELRHQSVDQLDRDTRPRTRRLCRFNNHCHDR